MLELAVNGLHFSNLIHMSRIIITALLIHIIFFGSGMAFIAPLSETVVKEIAEQQWEKLKANVWGNDDDNE